MTQHSPSEAVQSVLDYLSTVSEAIVEADKLEGDKRLNAFVRVAVEYEVFDSAFAIKLANGVL